MVCWDIIHTKRFLSQPDTHFMKKIPPGSEASNVLVGEVDFLSHAIIAFVRLKDGVLLGDITEVNLGPSLEIGNQRTRVHHLR